MRTFQKIMVGLVVASTLALGIVWGGDDGNVQKAVSTLAEDIQKPGHLALGDVVYIQKPGH